MIDIPKDFEFVVNVQADEPMVSREHIISLKEA